MSRIHSIALAALAATSLAGAATAAELHVGASIGRSDYRIDTTGAASADTRDTAGKLFVGATFTPHLSVEAAFYELGRASGSIDVPGSGAVTASARVRAIGVAGALSAPVGPVALFAKVGVANVRARLDSTASTGLPGSESSWQPLLGVGVSVPIAREFAVRGEWERVRARFPGGESDHIDLLSVGLSYRF